jgi:hypothetical protein
MLYRSGINAPYIECKFCSKKTSPATRLVQCLDNRLRFGRSIAGVMEPELSSYAIKHSIFVCFATAQDWTIARWPTWRIFRIAIGQLSDR